MGYSNNKNGLIMKDPLVSIITINYNNPEITAAMLQSLSVLKYDNYEVIVVDNASNEGRSSIKLKKKYPFISHISLPVNLGFAGGNNVALQFAKGEYIFLLNNDTEVTPDLITILVQYLKHNPDCGIACPKIKYFLQPQLIQYAGSVGLHPITSRSYEEGYLQADTGQFNRSQKTDLPNGAAMMVPMKLIEQIGGMSELFFLYYEELDWAVYFKKAGFNVHYVGTAEVFHKESSSTGLNSAFKTFYLYRNRFLYIRRNYKGLKFLGASAYFIFIASILHIIKHAFKKEWSHSLSILKGFWWNMHNSAYKEPKINALSFLNKLVPDK